MHLGGIGVSFLRMKKPVSVSEPLCAESEAALRMATHVHNFKCWYAGVLDALYKHTNAGFVILIVAFPLLERYLREKSGLPENDPLTDQFYLELLAVFPALSRIAVAKEFWQVYRNGLLHQVTLSRQNRKGEPMRKGSLRSDGRMLTIEPGDFWVDPVEFARAVIQTIDNDFPTFEGQRSNPLPVINITSNGTGPG